MSIVLVLYVPPKGGSFIEQILVTMSFIWLIKSLLLSLNKFPFCNAKIILFFKLELFSLVCIWFSGCDWKYTKRKKEDVL